MLCVTTPLVLTIPPTENNCGPFEPDNLDLATTERGFLPSRQMNSKGGHEKTRPKLNEWRTRLASSTKEKPPEDVVTEKENESGKDGSTVSTASVKIQSLWNNKKSAKTRLTKAKNQLTELLESNTLNGTLPSKNAVRRARNKIKTELTKKRMKLWRQLTKLLRMQKNMYKKDLTR